VIYTASDNNGGTASSTLAIAINPINDAPIATADTATMDEDAAPITIDVLANDSDVDGDSLVISNASADEGTTTIVNNQIQYTPEANANGVATVIYTASDNNGGTASSTLAIAINPINDAPIATADTATMDEDAAPITIDVLANDSDVDGDSLVISNASADEGTTTIVNNQIQYTPEANANGVATVIYTASDNNGGTASSTLAIAINPINDAPVATADTATMDEDAAPITIDVLANDSDVDGDSLVISNATADVGAVSVVNNQIQYTPAANANGVATVTYTASDNNGGTANSTLAITINPINDPPIVAEQSFSINEDATDSDIIGTIVATDNENQDLTYVLAGGDFALFSLNASSGILSVNGETPFDYETKTQYILNIQVTDNGTPNETTAVNITVNIIDVVEPLIPVEDTSFGRPISGQLDLGSVFSGGQFNDSIALNNNLYFVGFINNADKDILIVSYTNNGDVNTAFNTTGTKVLDLEQDEEATAIISDGTDLFISYSSFDGSNNEACVLKMDLAGALRTGSDDDGESNTGIKCTTLNSTTVINDLEIDGNKLLAVGKHFDGTQTDSLWIHYKTDDLSFENSTPTIVDVSGANHDDEGYAVKNFEKSDYLVVGSVTDADGTKNSLLRYLKSNGNNDNDFNGGASLTIDLSGNDKDDELFAIGGLADSNFTAFAGGYMTSQTGEKEAVVLAIDKNGELVASFDTDGIAIYDIDGNNGAGNGGDQVTGIQYEPIKNEIMLSGTTGVPNAEHVFTARVISSTGLLDDAYGESGVSILSDINAKQIVNTTSIDSNDTLWVSGIDDGTNAKPFIGAITDQAALFTNFNSTGYLTVDEITEASNDKSMKLIQLSNGAQAGKYMLASTAETNGVIKLVLTRFTSTGAIDTSFSETGHKEIAIELNSQHVALAELNNGNLLLAGNKKTTNGSQGFVAKVDQDGSLDTTFATGGIYVTNIENTEALTLSDIAITNSNNIVAVGTATQSGNAQSFAMMLTTQGVLATSFGTEGVLLGLTGEDFSKIHIDNNEIFIAGELVTGADSALIALKLNLTGNELFRYSGTDTPNINNKVASVLTDSSGAIYLVANLVATPDKANVVRLLSSGSLDTSFADNGVGQYSLAVTGNTLIKGAKLDSTDKLILVGTSNNQGVIARITTNGELDNTFGTSGVGYYQANLCTNSLVFSSLILQTDTQIALSSTCDNGNSNNISVSKFDFYPDGVEP
ncbi:MAG: tandem-95 repeat protein, partial [Pseudoalteromonas marina]